MPIGFTFSSTWMHPSSYPGHGYPVSGQVWYGKDSSVCASHLAADRTCGWSGEFVITQFYKLSNSALLWDVTYLAKKLKKRCESLTPAAKRTASSVMLWEHSSGRRKTSFRSIWIFFFLIDHIYFQTHFYNSRSELPRQAYRLCCWLTFRCMIIYCNLHVLHTQCFWLQTIQTLCSALANFNLESLRLWWNQIIRKSLCLNENQKRLSSCPMSLASCPARCL